MTTNHTPTPYRKIGCGCCTGDGHGARPENDQCVCHIHAGFSIAPRPRVCRYHAHDELVAALQRVVDLYVCRITTDPRANEKEEPEEIIFARAALAKVAA